MPLADGEAFHPTTPGVLKVATAFLPAPGFWEGTPPTKGFEAGLAADLAKRLGLQRVEIVHVPFPKLVAGDLGGADIALSQLTPTAARTRHLSFTTSYLLAPPGILARTSADASDVHGLQELRWVESSTSTLTPILESKIRPLSPVVVEDRTKALEVLRAGMADALLLDLPVALGLAASEPGRFHVLGQLSDDEGLAVALPHGSANTEIVDSSIRALLADGTIGRLADRWFPVSMDSVALILTK